MADTRVRLIAVCVFLVAGALVAAGEYFFHWTQTAYWIDHFLFGLGFTMLALSAFGSIRVAAGLTLLWSVGNEFVQDHFDRLARDPQVVYSVDWSHLAGDLFGLVSALAIYKVLVFRAIPRSSLGSAYSGPS
ncbi:hypothetical protein [uncultured Marinobacter sp.]|uniref:hypothetical protein n=1 Tax=uncultured Marinobacter sp. TaxID=187379 RepID=UPI0032B29CF1